MRARWVRKRERVCSDQRHAAPPPHLMHTHTQHTSSSQCRSDCLERDAPALHAQVLDGQVAQQVVHRQCGNHCGGVWESA